jgi:hypothetical protein
MMRKPILAMAGCTLLLSALVAGPEAQAGPIVPVGCVVAAPDTSRLDMTPDSDGLPRYAGWLGSERSRAFADQVAQAAGAVVPPPPATGKETIADRLRRGVIGTALDDNTQSVVLVTTPEFGRGDQLRDALARVRQTPETAGLKTRTITGCYSAKALIAIDELLSARTWHPDAPKASFAYGLKAATSTYEVRFDPAYPAAADALRVKLGPLGVVVFDKISPTGRNDDGSWHFGGAGIRPSALYSYNVCTSGFSVWRNSDWEPGSFSAGHCFGNGHFVYSGPKVYGYSYGMTNYPAYDVIGITRLGTENFDNVIHVDPCCPSQRNVVGKYTTWNGDVLCVSGMTTRAICGVRVDDAHFTFCRPGACTPDTIRMSRNGTVIVRDGDSGAPVYTRVGTNNANAVGMIMGKGDGGKTAYAEHAYHVENYLGVTIMTY